MNRLLPRHPPRTVNRERTESGEPAVNRRFANWVRELVREPPPPSSRGGSRTGFARTGYWFVNRPTKFARLSTTRVIRTANDCESNSMEAYLPGLIVFLFSFSCLRMYSNEGAVHAENHHHRVLLRVETEAVTWCTTCLAQKDSAMRAPIWPVDLLRSPLPGGSQTVKTASQGRGKAVQCPGEAGR